MTTRQVLFLCVENAARSLMAEAMFNADPPTGWVATSAGTSPAARPNPRTEGMLRELGLSLPDHPPRLATKERMDDSSIRVSMGCLDDASCPVHLKTLELRDWALPDPAKLDDRGFRQVRDELARRVRALRLELSEASAPRSDRKR
jgi:arsenate reductase (thioredoxin)